MWVIAAMDVGGYSRYSDPQKLKFDNLIYNLKIQ